MCLIKQPRHGDVWRSEGAAPPFLNSALNGDEQSASRPDRFNPRGKSPCTHRIGRRVRPTADLNVVKWKKKSAASAGIEPRAVQPVAIPTARLTTQYPVTATACK
jgi:hypothetical protein